MLIYGLLGYPLRYSLSPVIHQAAYRALGVEAAYLLWPTAPEDLAGQVEALRQQQDLGGFNVTVPHKTTIIPLLDANAPSAQAVNAVNTVVKDGLQLIGYNTDLSGFRASLTEADVPVAGQVALVLGAGGAARSACHVLLELGVERLYLANRTSEKADKLMSELFTGETEWASRGRLHATRHLALRDRVRVVAPPDLFSLAPDTTLLVNCTSSQDPWPAFGLTADDFWSKGQGWAVDLAYGRMLAGFLAAAKEWSWRTLSGEGMLLWQAVHAFELWTGESAPVEIMRLAMASELAGQQ